MTLHDMFEEGQKLWVEGPDGARPAIYVGSAEGMSFLGAPPLAYVVYADTRQAGQVELDRLTARE